VANTGPKVAGFSIVCGLSARVPYKRVKGAIDAWLEGSDWVWERVSLNTEFTEGAESKWGEERSGE